MIKETASLNGAAKHHTDRIATLSVFFLLCSLPVWGETGLRLPPPKTQLVPVSISRVKTPSSLDTLFHLKPVSYPDAFRFVLKLDSTARHIETRHVIQNTDLRIPRYLSLEKYLEERSLLERKNLWKRQVATARTQQARQGRAGRGLTIETPKIKSEAFKRVFGGETLSLNVNGTITIDGTMRNEKRSQVKTATDRAPNTNFQMKQTQRFTVEGKIGENVSVLVNQDSERPFEFENAIKLKYSSDEDGIIKSIEAGNVALSLPSTRFVTFSAQNSGLFGLKTELKIGNLDVTAIASMEKGQKKKLSLKGGKEEETFTVQDYEYKKGTYFFLDHGYRKRYPELDNVGRHYYRPDSVIAEIEVYKSDYNYEIRPGSIRAWALLEPSRPDTSFSTTENYRGYFLRLEPVQDYYIQPELGYLVMNMPLQESEVLAVAYKDTTGRLTGTLLAFSTDTSATPIFRIIKPRTPRPSDKTWNLEWKNVYSIGRRDIDLEGFELKLYYKPPSGDPKESIDIDGKARSFLNLFGLDNLDETGGPNPDNVIDMDPNILSRSRGELILPNLRPFDPGEDSDYPFPEEMDALRTPAVYDTTNDSYIRQQSKFYFEVKSAYRSPNYSLGMNVIEGTEEVMLNGGRLAKDRDYTIDYLSGNLVILSEEATNPNANLEINYESHQIMTIDKKSLMGARAEYTLWESGAKRSFIGATLLYLNQRTLDQRIRIGKDGPMNNLVWDVNSALYAESNTVTNVLNALPLLELSGPSSVSLEGEFAQVIPNPNTLNNESTGDKDGVAYLDDFEGAKRQISLGVTRMAWGPSSPPTVSLSDSINKYMANRGHLVWFNPYEQVAIQEIWPEREVTTNFGGTTRQHVLSLLFTPNTNVARPDETWSGVARSLAAGYADQTDSRFLEIWVQGDYGRLHVDMGKISEDVIPNTRRDTEDKKPPGGIRNEILDDDEDTGIDGVFGSDPPAIFHPHEAATISDGRATPYDFWDLNRDNQKHSNEPWSYDDWSYTSRSNNYDNINGTEGNRNDGSIIYPDTEDLNRNSDVDLQNDYYEFTFRLEKDHADTVLIAGGKGNEYGWRLYRIPLDKPTRVVGNPDWSRIEFSRIWVDGVTDPVLLSIAQIELAGNEWKLRGVMAAADSVFDAGNDSTLTVAVTNTHDNPEYVAPPGVEGVIDPLQKIQSKEQSLVIQLDGLDPGATAIAQKEFFQTESLIDYKNLRMFVHGGGTEQYLPDSTLRFFLRWGSDTQNKHYYEVDIPVFPGWDERNNIEIDFEILSRLKIEMEGAQLDEISELQENGHIIRVVGQPSLTNVRWLIIGVTNISPFTYTGQVWIDELRVSNVRKDKGMAMRARADIRLANFITLNGEYDRKDADFHTVNERFGGGSHSQSGNFNASIQMNELMPVSWGLRIPVTVSFSKSRMTPKYLPGSDVIVNNRTAPDSLLKAIRSENENKGLNISLSKGTKSRNFFVRYLVDPIQTRFNYTLSERSDSKTKYDRNLGLKGSFSYDLNFGTQSYIEPFKWMGMKGFLKPIAGTKFYYLPSRFSIRMDGNDTKKNAETSGGVLTDVRTANYTQNISTSLRPFTAISFDYTKSQTADMRYASWTDVLSTFNPGQPLNSSQQVSLNLTPKFIAWFTPSAKYSANYRWNDNPQQRQQGTSQSSSTQATLSLNANWDTKKFVQSFQKKSTAKSPVRRPVTRQAPSQTQDKKPDEQKEEKTEKKPFPLLSIFSIFGKVIGSIDPIRFDFSQTQSANNYGILGTPSFAYQIGTTMDPGVPVSPNVTSDRASQKYDQRITASSGFRITSKITTKLDYSYSSSRNEQTQTTGNVNESALLIKDKPIPFPNWTVQWSGLEKLPIISKFARSVSLRHAFSGRKTQTWNDSESNITQESISKDFRPLLGLSLTLKNGMNATAQYTTTETVQEQKKYSQGRTKQVSTDMSVTVNYSKRGGLKLPFMKKKLENSIDFSLTFSQKYNASLQSRATGGSYSETSRTENWMLKPTVSYTFTRTVRGGMNFEIGERKDIRAGTTKFTAFGLNAVISLSG